MEMTLTKDDLKSLVRGTSPHYNVMDNALVKSCGSFTGGFVDRWNWHSLHNLNEKQLIELYNICKESWKR